MKLNIINIRKSINKSFLKVKPNRTQIENFKKNILNLYDQINESETEEFHKNIISTFLKQTYYSPDHYVNTKGRTDLVIHNGKVTSSTVGVMIETKKPSKKSEMPSKDNLNVKALHELILYYLRERISGKNIEVKHLIITNIYEWFIFNANDFDRLFAQNKRIVKQFTDFEEGRLADTKTDFFYNHIAEPFLNELDSEISFTYLDIRDYLNIIKNNDKLDDNKLVALFKLFSPENLLKLPFANDNNSLDKGFYIELLHIIGLNETKEGSKKLIGRKIEKERDVGSLIENTITILNYEDCLSQIKASDYGANKDEQLYNIALELIITWINRILFLKLLEGQLVKYHSGDKSHKFLTIERITDLDALNKLFFQVLAIRDSERSDLIRQKFGNIPFLNSSLFEPNDLEHKTVRISNLEDEYTLPILNSTVLKDKTGKRRSGELNILEYLFAFLDAYDFASEGSEEIQEENKTLINASVLGLIFEKINGYKDGSFFTPGFITMYMSRETIRRAVVQKFNEIKNWNCNTINDVYNKIDDIKEANSIINSLKICDPAVGSGHFLVSALNEIIAIKNDLRVLSDREGKRLKEYHLEVVNDELIVTDEDGDLFEYNPKNMESQRIQETLFHEKQTIIENCLFGVDINPNSVKICRLRLWIELLKNAYYKIGTEELETLPNIDINIKCGNSLISRYALDADIKKALKNSKWTIDSYRITVMTYRNAQSKEEKHSMEKLINEIKNDFESEVRREDKKLKELNKWKQDLFDLTGTQLFDIEKDKKKEWEKKVSDLTKKIENRENEIEEIKNNVIYENAFEWRFEFPEVLNDEGDFIGFDVVIGNPPYIQLSKTANLTKEYKSYLLDSYETSGGRLNTFIFFIHLSNNILQGNGILDFIIPNTILSQEYYSFTRDFLINKVSLSEIVNFPILPFEDAVVETVLIQYINSSTQNETIEIKELSKEGIKPLPNLKKEVINRDSKFSFVYHSDPIIEKVFESKHQTFGTICQINQGIALKGDKSLSLKDSKENDNCYKLLDGRNINKFSITWDGVYLDYDLDRIHSCKRQDIFESAEKLMFRRVSSTLIFTYDDEQYYALNTLVIVNKIDKKEGPDLRFILGLMNSKLMNYVYLKKFKSTKTVFSEIQARSVKELPIPIVSNHQENEISKLSTKIIKQKKNDIDTSELEIEMNKLVYQLYGFTDEEINMVEESGK